MKKYLIVLSLLLFINSAIAYEVVYSQYPTSYTNRVYQRPVYNPYGNYNNLYYGQNRYRKTNYNNAKRIQRINRIRHLNRVRNNLNNLSWNLNRNKGVLTGYSTPITSDVYKNMGSDFWDKEFIKTPTINCNTDIFSMPARQSSFYNRGRIRNLNDGLSNKTGVRIIYD